MLCLAYNAGLRVSELVGLGLDDLKMPSIDEVHVIGKGRARTYPSTMEGGQQNPCVTGWLSGKKPQTCISSSMPWGPA